MPLNSGNSVIFLPGTVGGPIGCRTCGDAMDVERNVLGPTSYVEALHKREKKHDHFTCPNWQEDWHEQAIALKQEIENTVSHSLTKLLCADFILVLTTRKKQT